jgi:hypothetical protein
MRASAALTAGKGALGYSTGNIQHEGEEIVHKS